MCPGIFVLFALYDISLLSQVNDFCFRIILAVEFESVVGYALGLEVAHGDSAPTAALAHLYLRWHVGFLVDGEDEFLHRALLVLCHQLHLVVAAHGLHT